MYQSALELGLGERIALIPTLADPKNLFGVLRKAEADAQAGLRRAA